MMKFFKNVYYLMLCHLFPNKINSGAYDADFTMGVKREKERWFADIPYWPGVKWQLEMVAGADDLLDVYNQATGGTDYVKMHASLKPFDGCNVLVKNHQNNNGATYDAQDPLYNKKVWLCNVSKWVFGQHPDVIYYKMV